MTTEVKIPTLPESVADAVIVTWHKQPGENVREGDKLVDIETDKVVLEVPAPASGVLGDIIEGEGSTVLAGQVIGHIGAAEAKPETPAMAKAASKTAATSAPLSPAVRKLVAEHELDPAHIPASGRDGRLLKEDVLRFLDQHLNADADADAEIEALLAETPAAAPARPAPEKPVAAKAEQPAVAAASAAPAVVGGRPERRVPMTRLRARIAERLLEAQHNAAILTTFNEVNMQPVMDLRARYKDAFEKRHGVRLGFMSFFVKAAVEALKRFPEVNASIDGNDIVYHGYFDVGVAVSSPRGLVVPILRDADGMSLADIERTIVDFAKKAEAGTLSLDELTGGTFSVSNGGVFGSLLSTPIINPPQSAILGMHRTQDRPVAENGQVVIRPMMYLALSYDHRIVDGREAVRFLVTIKEQIEDPARLLLGV